MVVHRAGGDGWAGNVDGHGRYAAGVGRLMPWRGPSYEGEFPSLGWQVLDWAEGHFLVPDGPKAGEPFVMTDEQAAIVVKFYALGDRGAFVYRRAAVRRAKKWGKSPFLAVIALAEMCGPTVFDGWDAGGEPVGRPPVAPWVQIAAVSEDQTDNTYAALRMIAEDSMLSADRGGPLDVGLTRVYIKNGKGKLEPVTASAGSREGQRITFAVLDETHRWTPRNGGKQLAAVLRRNAGAFGGRTFESTNAHAPGEGSVAEDTAKAGDAKGVLWDSVEAPDVEDLGDREAVLAALRVAYGKSALGAYSEFSGVYGWVGLERIADEIQDPDTDPDDSRRFYFNQARSGSTKYVDMVRWLKPVAEGGLEDATRVVPAGEVVGLGFDGSINDDSTALYACTRDGFIFEVQSWERPVDSLGRPVELWEVPRREVDDAVAEAFATFTVGRFYVDPPKWWSERERWAAKYNPAPEDKRDDIVLDLDTFKTSRFAPACGRFATACRLGQVSHEPDARLAAHLAAARKRKVRLTEDVDDGRTMFVIEKEDQRKIDRAVAATLAYEAALTMPEVEAFEPHIW